MDDERWIEQLREKFGITYLRPFQELIIKHIFENDFYNKDSRMLACLPTGSGKSLCFMLPILVLKKTTIIIYPLIALMNDQANRFKKIGINVEIIKGGMSREERNRAIARLKRKESIVMLTNIEMLLYLTENNFLNLDVSFMIIDEVHTVVTWGEQFRPCYMNIGKVIKRIRTKHILAFTATMDKKILDGIVEKVFFGGNPYIIRDSPDRENIFYRSIIALNKEKEIESILQNPIYRPTLVFCPSRKIAMDLSQDFSRKFECNYYHAMLEKDQKRIVEEWFSKTKDGVLFSTIAFGMGIDIKGIRCVIHYSIPKDASSFLQEAGRGGRDGKNSYSFILSYPDEESRLKDIFYGSKCIRYGLLVEMNEEPVEKNCLGCNHCIRENYRRSGENEITSFIKRHPFTTRERASKKLSSKHIFKRKNNLSSWSKKDIDRALAILIKEGKIKEIVKKFIIIDKNNV